MNRKSLISGFLSLLIFAQCAVPSMAAENVGESGLLDEAVSYMKEENVLYGSADGDLNLDRPLTYGELAVFLFRIRDKELPEVKDTYPWYYGALAELDKQGDFPDGLTIEPNGGDQIVYNKFALRIILPYFGVYPYPMSLYPGVSYDIPGVEQDQMAWNAAILIGLISEDLDPMEEVTRGDLMVWMYRLDTGDFEPLVCPATHPIFETIKNEEDWSARNGFIRAMEYIPEKYLDDFVDAGWSLVFDADSSLFSGYDSAVGITYYNVKTIGVRNSSYVTDCHEFGHFVSYRTGIDSYLRAFYNLESEAVRGILGEYSMTNECEYFAVYFAKYLTSPDQRANLEEKAPYTYSLIEDALVLAEGLVDRDLVQDLYHQVLAQTH